MVPQEDDVFGAQNSGGSFRRLLPGDFSDADDERHRRIMAHEMLAQYLEYLRKAPGALLSNKEAKKMMVLAYQGTDLKYQMRNCDTVND